MKPLVVQHIDQLKHPPYKVGGFNTCAWRQDMEAAMVLQGSKPHSGLAGWVMLAPWSHPFWPYTFLSLIHLRPVEGLKAAKIIIPGATHEVFLMALNPERTPDLVNPFAHHLRPLNFAGQFIAKDDEEATAWCEKAVDEVMALRLSPDSDFRPFWRSFFDRCPLLRIASVPLTSEQHKTNPPTQ